jgi:hypothetical protein
MTRSLLRVVQCEDHDELRALLEQFPSITNELDFWSSSLQEWGTRGAPIWTKGEAIPLGIVMVDAGGNVVSPTTTIVSDASPWACGAKTGINVGAAGAQAVTSHPDPDFPDVSIIFTPEQAAQPQPVRELIGIYLAMETYGRLLRGRHVAAVSDCVAAVSAINAGGSQRSPELTKWTKAIWLLCIEHSCAVSARWVPGTDMVNSGVDALSRELADLSDQWGLNPQLFDEVQQAMGPFTVNLMASATRHQNMQRFWSRYANPGAEGFDSRTKASWNYYQCAACKQRVREHAFVCPSIGHIPATLERLRADRARATLVIPYWPTAFWFPNVAAHAVAWCPLPCFGEATTGSAPAALAHMKKIFELTAVTVEFGNDDEDLGQAAKQDDEEQQSAQGPWCRACSPP